MKRFYGIVVFLLFSIAMSSQVYDPVSWQFSWEKKSDKEYEIVMKAVIEERSHLYSMDIPEGGPIPTSFVFETGDFELIGEVRQLSSTEVVFDEGFSMDIAYFSHEAEFRQTVRSDKESFSVKGLVNYMACDDEKCSPPKDEEFEITISNGGNIPVTTGMQPSEKTSKGFLSFFLLSMLAGFAGILTPCVFPMIPMTVAFFSGAGAGKGKSLLNAMVFGISIILLYSSLGIIVSLTSAGAGVANALSTHWIPNLLFFSLFILFAVSFLGAFEIVLPAKWINKTDSKVDKGGIVAAFFLGVTTVLVSFSCTGPIVGALLVEAASGDVLRPTIGMFGFGLAFAIPFTLFALFPSVMDKLPKSGGWLNSVKVVLGFLMLAFSFKFIATIDSVYGLGIVTRDLVLAVWIVLFFILGVYLLGKIRFSHDSEVKHIGVFRLIIAIASFSFAVYLIPGLFGAPLSGVSGLLPARETAKFDLVDLVSRRVSQNGPVAIAGNQVSSICETPKYADKLHLPQGLEGYFDYEQGMACARSLGKPVLLDFKGHACSNCKEMESKVWSNPEVFKRLKEEFVIIALYVDDRTQLPENEWITSALDGKIKKTMGKVNEDFEITRFKTNALPLYVILDNDGNTLNNPMGHNLNVTEYVNWLDEGIAKYKALK